MDLPNATIAEVRKRGTDHLNDRFEADEWDGADAVKELGLTLMRVDSLQTRIAEMEGALEIIATTAGIADAAKIAELARAALSKDSNDV